MNYEIEVKKDSYGNDLYHVKPPKGIRMRVSGWWKTQEQAITAHENLLNK